MHAKYLVKSSGFRFSIIILGLYIKALLNIKSNNWLDR